MKTAKSPWFPALAAAALASLAAAPASAHDYVTLYLTVTPSAGPVMTAVVSYDSDPGAPTTFRDAHDGAGYFADYAAAPPDASLGVTLVDSAGNTVSPAGPCQASRITNQAARGGYYELKFVFLCGLDDPAHRAQYVLDFANQTRGDTLRTYAAGGKIPANLPLAAFESVTFNYSINRCAGEACVPADGGGRVVALTRGSPAGMSFFGEWSPLIAYANADMVTYGGAAWVAVSDSTIAVPGSDFAWVKVGGPGPKGATGARGAQGPRGPAGPAGAPGRMDPAALEQIQAKLAALNHQVSSLGAQVAGLTTQNAALQNDLRAVAKAALDGPEVGEVAAIYVARLEAEGLAPTQMLDAVSAQLGIAPGVDSDARLTQDPAQYSRAVRALRQQISVATAGLQRALAREDHAQALEWQAVLDGLHAQLRQAQQGLANQHKN